MEFVGKRVKKEVEGLGVLTGSVKSFDHCAGVFEIVWDGGNTEELELSKVASIFDGGAEEEREKPRRGRPKKRPRLGVKTINQTISAGMADNLKETVPAEGNLNAKFNLNVGCGSDGNFEDNMIRTGCFDLNLDLDCVLAESLNPGDVACSVGETEKRVHEFDLNLGAEDETSDYGIDGLSTEANNCQMHEGMQMVEASDSLLTLNTKCVNSQGSEDDIVSTCKQPGRKRRREFLVNLQSTTTETILRRSSRRGSTRSHLSNITYCNNDSSSPPCRSAHKEEQPVVSGCVGSAKPDDLPEKLQLPPCSQSLNLDGIHILDIFSIYSCLRSFSTLLFLSPFEMEDFVTALKCKSPSSLFDSIHHSLLQTMRTHLEYLSNEGSQSASNCLSSLDWDLLDLITWPVFMVEYLLLHSSGLKYGYDLSRLNLFKNDYYKQPLSVKVEMLRCLCDDMVEVEAIRSELSRRSLGAEPDIDLDRSANFEILRKRKNAIVPSSDSYLIQDAVDGTADWNSDECCLCKMDGILICCDGCPAAYHSKCVGVANDLLPEGDWYCPECEIDKRVLCMKLRKSLRGAELLGNDPHGRLFFSSCGYLLVLDSCNSESSFNYYQRNELHVVIGVLNSSPNIYGGILSAIRKHWDIPARLVEANKSLNYTLCSDIQMMGQSSSVCMAPAHLASYETHSIKNETDNGQTVEEYLLTSMTVRESPYISSEGSAETTQMSSAIRNYEKCGIVSEVPVKCATMKDSSLTSCCVEARLENNMESSGPGLTSSAINTKNGLISQMQGEICYNNYYSFAQKASSVAEELARKSSEKVNQDGIRSEEEIISVQTKAILKKSTRFSWPSIDTFNVDAQKEKCGWCFCCKVSNGDRDCLFNMNVGPVHEISKSDSVSHHSKTNTKSHLTEVIGYILSTEDSLHGLLLGPWLNPHHTEFFHKNILKASNVADVKNALLMLESNLHRLAFSPEWLKHVDTVTTMGSASHIVTRSTRTSSKHGIGKRKSRFSDIVRNPSPKAANGWTTFWWRGGKLSRQLFNWKVLPQSLASKAARQAGCTKVLGVLYPENSEYAKRSKYVAWRAAVEASTCVEQLAIQVREFDLSIRWGDIENRPSLSTLDKDSKRSVRLFKKVIIRRKSIEQEVVKYLLDFGRRKAIPDIVLKRGITVEESSSGRKKYWLEESYVPLHLLKSFEEKKIVRKFSKMNSSKVLEIHKLNNSSRRRGFSYLFSKAERDDCYQCGHCDKDVLIREAVSCQYCKGFFHRRHVKKTACASIAECTYTCHQCADGRFAKTDIKNGRNGRGGKVQSHSCKKAPKSGKSGQLKRNKKVVMGGPLKQSQDNKKAPVTPLRRSSRNLKYKPLHDRKVGGQKKGKQIKSKRGKQTVSKKKTFKHPIAVPTRKTRSHVQYSYWLNGLHLSRKPNDERVILFRRDKVLVPNENLSLVLDLPKCHLCFEAGHTSTIVYISCEICGDWFHGDAFGLSLGKIGKLIGFRCHKCRKRISPPVCPHTPLLKSDDSQLANKQNIVVDEKFGEVSDDLPHSGNKHVQQESHPDGDLGDCGVKEQLCPVSDPTQGVAADVQAENIPSGKKQKTESVQNISDEYLIPDIKYVQSDLESNGGKGQLNLNNL